jgi:hypothetical protein
VLAENAEVKLERCTTGVPLLSSVEDTVGVSLMLVTKDCRMSQHPSQVRSI